MKQISLVAAFILISLDAHAQSTGGLSSVTDKIRGINAELVALGSVLAITGFIWSLLAIIGRVGNMGMALGILAAGIGVANAEQIVGMFVR